MAIIGNTATEIGDVMIIKTEIPLVDISSILSYTDSTVGETGTRFFIKTFRYSLDGGLNFNFEDYIELTNPNLAAIPVSASYDLIFEYRYERGGTDPSGVLEWNHTQLITTSPLTECGPVYDKSVFHTFFSTYYHPMLLRWSLNVLEKIYRRGLLPTYIERDENQNINQEDRDFIDFWRTITHYFALLVGYARAFEEFRYNKDLLNEFLRQRGVYICENQSLLDSRYIQENYWDEMRHRGTSMIALPKDTIINGNPKKVDGELLRLICWNKELDEFLFSISEFDTLGWVINSWSPLWQGISHQNQLNKIYEPSINIEDINNYPIINPTYVAEEIDGIIGNTLSISNVPAGEQAGIGIAAGGFDIDFATNISENVSYELSFLIKTTDLGTGIPKLSVGLFGYNYLGLGISFQGVEDSLLLDQNYTLERVELPTGIYMKVSCILFPLSETYIDEPSHKWTNLGVGRNLKIKSAITTKLIPQIIIDNSLEASPSGKVNIYDIKFRPSHSDYSTGFINTSNVVQTWVKNNQKKYTEKEISEIIKEYLIPYSASLITNFI